MIIGLDVGGTHTDAVLLDKGGLVSRIKVPTDDSALYKTVLACLDYVTRGIDPSQVSHVALSTTLTTNAIVSGNTPPVGMIVCGGPGIHPGSFRVGDHFRVVPGAIDHSGREIRPVDENEVDWAASQLEKEGIRYVGVCGKFSTRNPAHEIAIARRIEGRFEKVFMGHRCSGNFNFPRRITTTYLNASVYSTHRNFFTAVRSSLSEKGIKAPIKILKADGGTMDLDASIESPAQSILSGPAASVMGSIAFAPSGIEAVVLDIGGTTTDMAVLVDKVPVLAPQGIEIGPYKTLIRALYTRSIGIGGDSRVRYADGRLVIGPERKGPALAYGGPFVTPTDALFVLGKGDGGDREAARRGIAGIAASMGISETAAAYRIFDTACRMILKEVEDFVAHINSKPVYTVKELLEGHKVAPSHLVILGGPAPYFAEHFESIAGYKTETVPQWDVANAIGTALSRITCEVVLFADTATGEAVAPEEGFSESIHSRYSETDARKMAFRLLRDKAKRQGVDICIDDTDLLEFMVFNMVRGFRLVGRNYRVRMQVRPGLVPDYEQIAASLTKAQG